MGACQKNEMQLQGGDVLPGAGTRMMVYFGNPVGGASRGDVLADKTPGKVGENVMEVTYNKVEFTLIDQDGGRERTITLQNGEADKATEKRESYSRMLLIPRNSPCLSMTEKLHLWC